MRILITGVAGLIGGNLASWLVANTTHEVFGIDDLSCGDVSNIPPGVKWTPLTLGTDDSSVCFDRVHPDIVYHLAAHAAECLSPFIRCHNYRNNLIATADVVNQCINHDVERLVYASSMAVYGRGNAPFGEADPCQPIDPYGVAKLACEQDIRIASEQHGLEYCIVRPHNVYGPGQVITQRYRNVLGIWMWRHMHGLPLLIYGDGCQRRAFSWIGDCVAPLYRAAIRRRCNGQTVNLGGGECVTIQAAAELLIDVMGGGEIEYREPRHEVRDAWSMTGRSEVMLDYRGTTPLRDGMVSMWAWATSHEHPDPRDMPLEIERGIYEYWRLSTAGRKTDTSTQYPA